MVDLSNTWCEATKENRKALLRFSHIDLINEAERKSDNIFEIYYTRDVPIKKQIHLVNGEFEYVENKPKNNFEEYGFTADFEGEILKEVENSYIGWHRHDTHIISCSWEQNGDCYSVQNKDNQYNLIPIKKPWYEDKSNFPTILVDSTDNDLHLEDYPLNEGTKVLLQTGNLRPATKEEVLKLLIKD